MRILGKGFSVSGPQREVNEDVLHIDTSKQIFLVADGMGGHVGGAKASKFTSEAVVEEIAQVLDLEDVEQFEQKVREAVSGASQKVYQLSNEHEEFRGMGTTLTALVHKDGNGVMAHVGDSRLCLFRGGTLHQLSQDHTIVAEMLMSGKITPTQAQDHPYSHVLTRAVGVHEAVSTDTLIFELALDDKLIICSDGFYDLFSEEEELLTFVTHYVDDGFLEQAERLVQEKNASDNVTVALLEVVADEEHAQAETARSDEVVLKVEVLREVNLFKELDIAEIVSLVQGGLVHRVSSGKDIITEGKALGDSLYVILEGEVEVSKGGQHLSTLSSGNHFGEMSILLKEPRSATVKAASDVSLVELPRKVVENLITRSPRAGVEILLAMSREFAERLNVANEIASSR